MPEMDYVWLPREDILHFEEIETLVGVLTSLGVDKVRLTGGEPLLRRDLPELIHRLAGRPDELVCGRQMGAAGKRANLVSGFGRAANYETRGEKKKLGPIHWC